LSCCLPYFLLFKLTYGYEYHRHRPFVVERKNVAGIWRLTTSCPPLLSTQVAVPVANKPDQTFNSFLSGSYKSANATLVLIADGSFKMVQDTEMQTNKRMTKYDVIQARFQRGTWDVQENKLILASERISSIDGANLPDSILVGEIQGISITPRQDSYPPSSQAENLQQRDCLLAVPVVRLYFGKFMYPKHHPSFFDWPMLASLNDSPTTMKETLELQQVVSSYPTASTVSQPVKVSKQSTQDSSTKKKYDQRDFYNKRFFMTVVPVEPKSKPKTYRKQLQLSLGVASATSTPLDLQVLRIHFFPNSTFCARGINKILRGRFTVEESEFFSKYHYLDSVDRFLVLSIGMA
jgi:hypothetical protein